VRLRGSARPGRARLTRAAHAALAALLLLAVAAPRAADVTLNLENADIGALIATVSEITGKNFIVDPRVKGKVTVISSHPMKKEEIYQVFLSILQTHGFSAVPSGPVVKIIPDANARQAGPDPLGEDADAETDTVTTRVIRLENVSAAQLVPLLRPLVPQEGHLAAYPATNVLIVTDRTSNVRRLVEIIRRVDQATDTDVEVIRLRHASAVEVVRILSALEQKPQAGEAPRAPAVLSADERTNSVLLSGDRSARLRLRTLVTHLDTPLETTGNTHVIYLRYAKAKDLVPVLTGIGEGGGGGGGGGALAPPGGGGGGGGGVAGGKEFSVVAEERTNALVVTAPQHVLDNLRSVVRQLDIRRAQVLVEAIIAEVSPTRSAELGVQWRTDPNVREGGFASVTRPLRSGAQDEIDGEDGIRALRGGLTLGFFEAGTLRFLVRALAEDGTSNVLSTPTLVTMDNEEAEIVVGQNVPFVTGQYSSSTTTVDQPFQTIQRQDVGIILKVKPQINEGDAIRLDIKQEVSSVIPGTSGSDLQTSKRSVDTKVMVDDGQVLVLGGLIEDKLTESVSKVPILGDIPVLGYFFRSRRLDSAKVNLMIFLRPTILRGPIETALVTSAKYSQLRTQQDLNKPGDMWLIPGAKREVLPPMPAAGEPLGGSPPAPAPDEREVQAQAALRSGGETAKPLFPWDNWQ
jgi:general secretion pathway protein D